ncbi:MAG TPA: aromatic amino acid lyase, partial [Gammaproteobacteria bacterium]|nr:aromatic amino acid lyase [Gammaproteobacteria bacterium]
WRREPVRISDAAMEVMRETRGRFLQLLEHEPETVVYGVTTGYGQMAKQRLDGDQRRAQAARPPHAAAASFGEPLPERVVRGIVFARLVNYVEGYAAISPELARGVADMLGAGPLPEVPAYGASSAGEILSLAHLFGPLAEKFALGEKDSLSLVNGAPCAAALVADAVLAAESRQQLALRVFALSADAIKAPLEAYDAVLQRLWGDDCDAKMLAALRALLEGAASRRRSYQTPVSFRALPRLLGQMARATVQAREVAATLLRAITDNPLFLAGDDAHPHGRVISNGGFHAAAAAPALDALAGAWADLALVCDRQANRLLDAEVSLLPDFLMSADGAYIGCLGFVSADYAEQARHAAQRTFLPGSDGGGFGQNDLAVPTFAAWRKLKESGRCLDANLAILAAVASQAFYVTDRRPAPALGAFLSEVRQVFAPMEAPRAPGPDAGALAAHFTRGVYADAD